MNVAGCRLSLFSKLTTLAFLLFLLAACGEGMLSGPVNNNGLVLIESSADGSALNFEELFEYRFEYDTAEVQPDEIIIEIWNASGELLYSGSRDFNSDHGVISLEDFPNGRYKLIVMVHEADGTMVGDRHFSVYRIDDVYTVYHVASYPTRVEPDSEVLVFADIQIPEHSDPYVRWRFEDRILSEGALSELGNTLRWRTPNRPGVYTLNFDLFPYAPDHRMTDQKRAPFSGTGSVFTVQSIEPGSGEFAPESEYLLLHHFRGNFRNYGRMDRVDPRVYGQPSFSLYNGILGYVFSKDSGLLYDRNLLKPGEEEPYERIIQFKGYMFNNSRDQYFSSETGSQQEERLSQGEGIPTSDESFTFFSIGSDFQLSHGQGNLNLKLFGSSYSFPHPGGYTMVGIRLVEKDNLFLLEWYSDGLLEQQDILDQDTLGRLALLPDETRLGFGFPGIIDEFGIIGHATEEERIDLFQQAMQIRYDSALILAQEFRGDIDLRLRPSEDSVLDDGLLYIPEEGYLFGQDIPLESTGLNIIFSAEPDSDPEVALVTDNGLVPLDVSYQDGNYIVRINSTLQAEDNQDAFVPLSDSISFQISGPLQISNIVIVNRSTRSALSGQRPRFASIGRPPV